MDPAYKILAKSPVPVLMAGTPRSVNLPELRDQVLAALGQPNRTGVEGSPEAFEGSSRFGTDPRKFNRPTESGAMERVGGKPIPMGKPVDWLPDLREDRRTALAKEYASRFLQKHETLDKALKNLGELESLNTFRDKVKSQVWKDYGVNGPKVDPSERLEGEQGKSWSQLSDDEKKQIIGRVNQEFDLQMEQMDIPGAGSVKREILKQGKIGRESRVSFPMTEEQLRASPGATRIYEKLGVIPEDPTNSGAIWYDPSKKPDNFTQNFQDDFQFNPKDALGNPASSGAMEQPQRILRLKNKGKVVRDPNPYEMEDRRALADLANSLDEQGLTPEGGERALQRTNLAAERLEGDAARLSAARKWSGELQPLEKKMWNLALREGGELPLQSPDTGNIVQDVLDRTMSYGKEKSFRGGALGVAQKLSTVRTLVNEGMVTEAEKKFQEIQTPLKLILERSTGGGAMMTRTARAMAGMKPVGLTDKLMHLIEGGIEGLARKF